MLGSMLLCWYPIIVLAIEVYAVDHASKCAEIGSGANKQRALWICNKFSFEF